MDIISVVDSMPLALYERLKFAAETGKWPEGQVVSEEQRASALQLSMAYQSRHLDSQEMLTIGSDGQMIMKNKRELKEELKQDNNKNNQQDNIARFTDI